MITFQNGNSYNSIPKSSIKMIIYGAGEDYIRVVFNHSGNERFDDWRDYHFESAAMAARTYFSITGGQD